GPCKGAAGPVGRNLKRFSEELQTFKMHFLEDTERLDSFATKLSGGKSSMQPIAALRSQLRGNVDSHTEELNRSRRNTDKVQLLLDRTIEENTHLDTQMKLPETRLDETSAMDLRVSQFAREKDNLTAQAKEMRQQLDQVSAERYAARVLAETLRTQTQEEAKQHDEHEACGRGTP
ncbi:hypothetical protein LTR17_027718, partial [Elasticomyces elasticus]